MSDALIVTGDILMPFEINGMIPLPASRREPPGLPPKKE
jgi:hypothetical protein